MKKQYKKPKKPFESYKATKRGWNNRSKQEHRQLRKEIDEDILQYKLKDVQ